MQKCEPLALKPNPQGPFKVNGQFINLNRYVGTKAKNIKAHTWKILRPTTCFLGMKANRVIFGLVPRHVF